jgi:hypothetical protein
MGILSVLNRKPVVVEEVVEEVVEQEPQPTGPYLAVLEPDVAGISSFRLRFFPRSGQAEDFVATLRPDARHGTHAFWAMHDRPTPQEGMHVEALVLVRTHDYSDVVYVVSFLDIESAQSFTRFEVKRGLSLGNVLIYWAAFAQVREELESVSVLPAAAPAPLPPDYVPPETPSAAVVQAEAAAEQYEEQIESIIPEFQAPRVENTAAVAEPPAEPVAPTPPAPRVPEVETPAIEETIVPPSVVEPLDISINPVVQPEPEPTFETEPIVEDSIVAAETVPSTPAPEVPVTPPAEPQSQPEAVAVEPEVESIVPVAGSSVVAPPAPAAPEQPQPAQEPEPAGDPQSGAPVDPDEASLDHAYVFRHSKAPDQGQGSFGPSPEAPADGDAVGAIAYVQPASDPFTDAALEPVERENSCYAEVTEGVAAMESEVEIAAEVGLADGAAEEDPTPATASTIAIQEMTVGRSLMSEGADVGMIVDVREKAGGAVISFGGDEEFETHQGALKEPEPPEVPDTTAARPLPRPQASTAVAEPEPPEMNPAEAGSFDAEREIQRLLKNRRWDSKDSPFDGFNSPPGRF